MSQTLLKDSGFRDQEIPYCHHMIIYNGPYEYDIHCPVDDPRVEKARKDGKLVSEIPHCSVHYFDDIGFLHCDNCGWTP